MILRPPRSTLLTHSFPTRRSSDLGTFSNKAADPDGDGRFATDEFGFVASDKGGPVRYGTHRQAAQWIINHGHKRSPDQIFEIENHPSGKEIGRPSGRERVCQYV